MDTGHSLWLVPREPARTKFQDVIDRQSLEHGTPGFRAHATLIAGVDPEGGASEVLSKAENLASELKAISASVERITCKDLYFQSVSVGTNRPGRGSTRVLTRYHCSVQPTTFATVSYKACGTPVSWHCALFGVVS